MKTNRKLAKAKKNAEVAAELADLRAALKVTRGDLVTSGRRIGELETEIAALEAERELGAEVDKSNDMVRAPPACPPTTYLLSPPALRYRARLKGLK